MSKTIIVSNRLPLQIKLEENNLKITPSVGGLATGMKSVHSEGDGLWIGWSGLTQEELTDELREKVATEVRKEKCATVPLTQDDMDRYYFGFSNRTLWPLFHYFMEYTEFEKDFWDSYKEVNEKFAKVVLENAEDGDTIWVHDYQLLLLPGMIRDAKPDISIGFFLHIPFPSYEIFRTFPWREEVLHGMLGADLLGFHTYDYERHFLSSVKRILREDVNFNEVVYQDRVVKVDSFPMGIDYQKFYKAAQQHTSLDPSERSDLQKRIDDHFEADENAKLILSIDRMDYTKGIPNRIRAFEYFLNKYPEYKNKVRLVMLAVPSRSNVPQYQLLKKETDELVGRVNGELATVSWTPIWYFYRSLPFDNLIDLYTSADVALITPVRDGMNLVAKEYIATRVNKDGVLILSEMAGAAQEMNEALLINPNNFEATADALKRALEMPVKEQKKRNTMLQKRLQRYSVDKWAAEFFRSLEATKNLDQVVMGRKINTEIENKMVEELKAANRSLMMLDYDGTLTGFKDNPEDAAPDEALIELLQKLNAIPGNDMVIISGRDRETLEKWFGKYEFNMITDHGVWMHTAEKGWQSLERIRTNWMENIRPILETFTDRTPGSFIEEKRYSLAWHYRKTDPELGVKRVMELDTVLTSLISNNELSVLKGNMVTEIKSSNVNKGRAVSRMLSETRYDFMFAIGDDWTDEYMFEEMPSKAYTVKVGYQKTKARFHVHSNKQVRALLEKFTK
ncbi:bifunctional alpha,alpha-trehalose-phosphate synthase (UDP-forming)/trehalose-phosphatase [Robertkochia sediminum]|uniref:bifunctional alpha,alpha-trehalose-phosphate synthase (UDP-forming)/trehalose-phosphatase n=1 Tax=Robertkochia sediminum TaxID=2785326 RepID=UPI0019323880|nr:bifunctional alpha,alpha-trehalose-phosphate synthase (UDP-forming)/trehalose-phosphatase [Robertkochia sediminum]MBL7472256.1 bifunctional alpha,alpha-trehalose-phosphate synthase (UDP-forming)/trehalose-phosphatase [Robertkochia sediminum]